MGSRARARTAALAALTAWALLTAAVSADGPPAHGAGSAAHDGAKPPATVTLLTGDRVAVGSDGQVVRLVRGKAREGIGFSVRREGGHTYVVPQDALCPVADGVLDRRLSSTSRSWSGTGTTTRTAPRCR